MDKARRREEIYNRDKGEELFVQAQDLAYEALSLYHKDWPTAIGNLQLAGSKLKKAKTHFTKAGLVASRLKEMTPGARRVHARDIMDILADDTLTFLSEPKLPEVCVTDFLDRSAPIMELEFRLESELEKAKARSEGDAQVPAFKTYIHMHTRMHARARARSLTQTHTRRSTLRSGLSSRAPRTSASGSLPRHARTLRRRRRSSKRRRRHSTA